jgi:hypothetical protein
MIKQWAILAIASSLNLTAWADEAILPQQQTPAWFTGSLIAPTGTAIPYGDFEIEPYIYYTVNTGAYNQHWNAHSFTNFYSFSSVLEGTFGLTPWMDVFIFPALFWNRTENQGSEGFGDLPLGFDFQLYSDQASWFPGIKLSISENFPTGKYQHLNPSKLGADAIGYGTFGTSLGLVLYHEYQLSGIHYITLTCSAQYTLNTPVKVHSFNTYGGGYGTRGTIHPGNLLEGVVSFEVNFTKNWAFALDTVYVHKCKTGFSGYKGVDRLGNPAIIGSPASEQLSFAPAIEYNFSESLGLIAGTWLSAAGRNSTQFRSAVGAFYYYY